MFLVQIFLLVFCLAIVAYAQEDTESPWEGLEISGFFDVVSNYDAAALNNSDFSLGQAEVDLEKSVADGVDAAIAIAYDNESAIFGLGAATVDLHLFGREGSHFWKSRGIEHSGIIAGQFDVPFGIDWEVYPSIDRKLISAPLVVENTHGGWNDFGFQFYLASGYFNFVGYAVNGFESMATIQTLNLSTGLWEEEEIDTTPDDAYGGRFGLKPAPFAEFGTSFAVGLNKSRKQEMSIWGVDAEFDMGNALFKGEYIYHEKNKAVALE